MSDIKDQIQMLHEIDELQSEFDAAYDTRREDPERWDAAKHAFQAKRTFWKSIRELTQYASSGTATGGVDAGSDIQNEKVK